MSLQLVSSFFFFNDTATTEIYTLSLHDALPILRNVVERAVYRWEDHERPIDRIQFDPFESPWRPRPPGEPASVEVLAPPPAAGPVPVNPWDPESCADFRQIGRAHV